MYASLTTDSYCSYIHTDNVHKATTIIIINYTTISLYIIIKHNSAYVTYYVHYSHHPLEEIAHTMH